MEILTKFTTDWLNTDPVFINTKTRLVSRRISDVLDFSDLEFDPEGLSNYLRFGYIVFTKTPFRNVEKLPPNSQAVLSVGKDGRKSLEVTQGADPVLRYIGRQSSVEECVHLIKDTTNNLVSRHDNDADILLPLSGGYDSRMLLSVLDDKSRLKAVTYDISLSQNYSFETVRAKFLCDQLNVDWRQINLRCYWSQYITDITYGIFGSEMSLQPSYHVEMYEQAKTLFGKNLIVLSGSVGDWWSGEKLPLFKPETWEQCLGLFHTIGIAFSADNITLKHDESYNESCIKPLLDTIQESYLYRTVFSKRGRIGLASFICRTAGAYFPVVTPFYDIDVAMAQVNLPEAARKDREWQKSYFASVGMDVDGFIDSAYSFSANNSLDLIAAHFCASSMDLIDENLFDGIIRKDRIRWINERLNYVKSVPMSNFMAVAKSTFSNDNKDTHPPTSRLGRYLDSICPYLLNSGELFEAVNEWSILLPLQMSMQIAGKGSMPNRPLFNS